MRTYKNILDISEHRGKYRSTTELFGPIFMFYTSFRRSVAPEKCLAVTLRHKNILLNFDQTFY